MIEHLESRQLLSGVVTVTTNSGPEHRLLIRGDDAGNEVRFIANFSNGYEEEMSYNTLVVYAGRLIVDGAEIAAQKKGMRVISSAGVGDVKVYQLYGPTTIDLGAGDDALVLDGDRNNAFASIEILTGDGDDRVSADGGFLSLKIDTGAGNDRVTLRSQLDRSEGIFGTGISGVRGDLNVSTGTGRDRVLLDSDDTFLVRGKLRIVDHSGPTTLGMHAVRAKRGATVATGNAADTIVLKGCFFKGTTVFSTRGGDDIIRLLGTGFTLADDEVFLTGAGRDVLQRT